MKRPTVMVRKQEVLGTDKQKILWVCEGKVRNITQRGMNYMDMLPTVIVDKIIWMAAEMYEAEHQGPNDPDGMLAAMF